MHGARMHCKSSGVNAASITHIAANFQRWISSIAVVLVDDIAILWRAVEGLAAWCDGIYVRAAPLGLQAAMSRE
jgi:hypothetical protein